MLNGHEGWFIYMNYHLKKTNKVLLKSWWSFSFVTKTVYYSTILRKQGSLIEVVHCFKEEVTGWFLIP